MSNILERAKAQVVKSSSFDPMQHVVEVEAGEFYELIHEIERLEQALKGPWYWPALTLFGMFLSAMGTVWLMSKLIICQ